MAVFVAAIAFTLFFAIGFVLILRFIAKTSLHSLPSLEDSDFTNLFCGSKPGDVFIRIDSNQTVNDSFLGAKLVWKIEMHKDHRQIENLSLVLKLKKNDKRRIFRQYIQHMISISDEIEKQNREIKMHITADGSARRWMAVPFTHPATFGTVVMDADLLYGKPGTGKSSFVAAMAKFLQYDIYQIDMSKVSSDSDLTILLLQTTPKSLILVEDLDRHLMNKSTATSVSGVLNFMDGIASYGGEERVVVFTMNEKNGIDEEALRPGRIDVHIHFPACDFSAFKSLAVSHLGVKDHKLFSLVEEVFQSGAAMSAAEIGEIMIANRSSPSRALKSIIVALQIHGGGDGGREDEIGSGRFVFKEKLSIGKLYGLLRLGTRKNEEGSDSPLRKQIL